MRYRQYASNCLRFAQEASDPASKSSILDVAQVWLTLADQTERDPPPNVILQQQQPQHEQ